MGRSELQELGSELRVLVWNIYKAKRTNWFDDFSKLTENKELVLLQEAVRNAPSDAHFDISERYEWIMAASHQHPVSGVITGVKSGCVAKSQKSVVHRSNYSEPVVKTQKLLLETHYSLAGRRDKLLVLNMHAINFVGVQKYIDQLDQLSDALQQHTGPVVLAGDFNTWNPKRSTLFKALAEQAGLIEASMTRRGKIRQLNQHLDHVFYRGLGLRSVESLQHISSSDHAPITATFTVE